MELEAEREKIRQEIEELERSLGPVIPSDGIGELDSSLESGSEEEDDLEEDESDTQLDMEVDQDGEKQDGEEEEVNLPQTPETCLQMNLVYQEVIQEKIEEINSLLAQNKKQQEKLTWELAGTKGIKSSDGKSLPANMFLGHFMKPYFKDKTSGFGPPANDDAREKARQGIKSFEELITVKWKSREKLLLQQAVVSDRLQHLLQPKMLKVDYLNEKREKSKDEVEKQILGKQIQETEREISEINMLPEETLLGNRHDEHDWDKIANINFEGTRNANELRKYWQNYEHPNINKKEWSEEEIEKLKEIAVQHGGLHWEAIAQELGTQRTAFQCLQKFQSHNKDFKRSEWSPEEDQMLRQLVQEMRIGNHIPYRKMAYYMEGRDSAQLIYRWTKRVDPNLKRGAWTPKEDALLLKAVAKYGERDWYKIRAEVPGRNDLQCRDRYLHSLHYDIKKGKWSQEEEKKLIELTEKYGRGHWAKIASELPHRSGSQCLSKWKILLGYRRYRRKKEGNRRHPRRRRVHRWSSSPSESSSEYSDLDLDAEEEEDERPKAHQPKGAGRWRVPSLDLWVPARKEPLEANPGGLPAVTLLSKGFDVNRKRRMDSGPLLGPEEDQRTDDLVDLVPETPELAQMKGNENSGKPREAWKVSLAYVKSVLRRNSYEQQRRNREIRRKKRFASSSSAGPRGSQLTLLAGVTNGARRQRDGIGKTTLNRRLMLAVTPWAGNMVQEWALRMKEAASRKSKADMIFRQLQTSQLTSTPLFTFLIQLLHIDVDGCMKVIQRRKSRQPELLKAIALPGGNSKQPSSSQDAKAQLGQPAASGQPNKKLIPLKAKEGPVPANTWKARSPPGLAPKPKTVSELLREKRLREQSARKGSQKRIFLAPQLLLSASVVVPQTRGPMAPLANCPNAPAASQVSPRPPPASASVPGRDSASPTDLAGASRERSLPCNGDKDEAAGGEGRDSNQESFSPQGDPAGPPAKVNPILAEALCPSPASGAFPPLLPTLVAAHAQPTAVAQPALPISWVLTPQGLLPVTLLTLPSQGKPLASGPPTNPSQPAETSVQIPTPTMGDPVVEGSPMPAGHPGCPQSDAGPRLADVPPPPPPPPPLLGNSTEVGCPPSPAGAGAPALPCTVFGGTAASAPNSEASPPPHPNQGPATQEVPSNPALEACPTPRPPQEGTASPLSRLLSLEAEPAVKAWAKENREGRAPVLGRGLPYLPPFLCSLKTLSALLLNKRSLEQSAASLLDPEGQREEPSQPDLEALRQAVRQKLQDNPAYQLLRERFLAAFSFPAALAALPPPRVVTTLSGGRWWEGSQGEDSSSALEEEEEEEGEEEEEEEGQEGEEEEAEREPQGATRDGPAETMEASEELEEPGTYVDSGHSSPGRIRRSRRLQKRGIHQ
ncbi:snRNA-activating protein complex subunit 4 [Pseudonaja textilis]|uniref:snRNA-activating protein complex subunit 4 n=1 Tax=Pseudonaja textilis TaxID=8673 RepID=UPI000EAA8B4A|nr:snRNA-activating protein complex subunit 4 [Pseudonaja textilis]XP_026574914.1 snRNA-activating protein complex subunit 4 [Pseudonaja textilis]